MPKALPKAYNQVKEKPVPPGKLSQSAKWIIREWEKSRPNTVAALRAEGTLEEEAEAASDKCGELILKYRGLKIPAHEAVFRAQSEAIYLPEDE